MSEMEMFFGTFEETDIDLPEDEDDLLDLEKTLGVAAFVEVDGVKYMLKVKEEVDIYGFSMVIPPSDESILFLCWYNGGGSIEEVASIAIRRHLKSEPFPNVKDRLYRAIVKLSNELAIAEISQEAMAEVKATIDGESVQTIREIVDGCMEEINDLSNKLKEVEKRNNAS